MHIEEPRLNSASTLPTTMLWQIAKSIKKKKKTSHASTHYSENVSKIRTSIIPLKIGKTLGKRKKQSNTQNTDWVGQSILDRVVKEDTSKEVILTPRSLPLL